MRKNNLTRKGIISVLLILILTAYSLSSCSLGFGTTISKMDDSINKKYQDILKELDNDVLSAIHNNDSRGFNDLISHELRNTGINIESFTAEMGEILKDQELSYLKRYHSKLRKIGNHGFTIMSPSEDEMFVARISGVGNEVLVSFRKTMTGVVDYALNTIYIKEKGEWKIGSIHLCAYSVQDKSALELYGEAKTLIEQGYTLPAFFMYILWNQVSALGDNFQYKNIVEMR
ncbi:MAG: hypothetical protein R3232_03475, partial [Clostridia bacterium]|nr:hypothetical protein [Clostridia bacterium]